MTASPSSRKLASAVLLSCAVLATSAAGQVGPPVRLLPPQGQTQQGLEPPPPPPNFGQLPPGQLPGQLPTPMPRIEPPPRGETVPRPPPVRVDALQAPDPSNVGLLDPARGGFPLDMWRGTRRATVQALLPQLPAGAPSPAMQDLARRLLLSAANPPGGPSGGAPLLGLRLERLAAAGRVAEVAELLKASGGRPDDPNLALALIEAALLAEDTDAACAQAKSAMASRPGPEIAKVAAFCQATGGEKNAAALAGDLLREQGQKDDAYFTLLDQLTGARRVGKLTSLKQASALHLMMLRATKQSIPDDAARDASNPAVLRAIAASTNASADTRLDAAERAAAAGALTPAELGQIYADLRITTEERNAAAKGDGKRGPRSFAVLYQVAQGESEDGKRLELLRRAMAMARGDGRFVPAAQLWQSVAATIQPTGTLENGAGDMARVLLANGDAKKARDWLQVERRAGLELWPLTLIGDGGTTQAWTPQRLGEWLQANAARDGSAEIKARRAQLLLAMLEALGYGVLDEHWDAVLASPARGAGDTPAPAVWRALRQAAQDKRLGESVLAGLVAIGEGGPGRANPAVIATAVEALRNVRLDREARALALEALLAGGL